MFSFFTGVFTKTIETWIFAWVQKLLPGDKKDEFDARVEYKVENSCFVTKLQLDEDLAYMLYSTKVRTIEDLASFDAEELIKKVNLDTRNLGEGTGCLLEKRPKILGGYTEKQIQSYINRARDYMGIGESDFVKKLDMDKDVAFKLYYFTNVKTLEDLKNCDPKMVHEKLCKCKYEAEELAKRENISFEKVHEMLCDYSETKIESLKEKAEKLLNEKSEAEKPDSHSESECTEEHFFIT